MFFFFVVAPFCSCPASLVSRKYFAVGPGCAKCFFFCCAPLGAATFRRGQSKKKHHPGCFFFAPAPGKGKGRRSPVGSRHGARAKKKKHHPGCFFFAAAPAKGKGRRSPVGSRHGARAKTKHQPGCFFLLRPRGKANTLGGVFVFCSGPVPASNGASPSLAFRRGRSKKKKHPGWCFFFCSGPVPASNGASPSLAFRRGRSKKKTPWVVFFFFCCGPARTLTHSLRAWVAMPPPRRGGVFFFAAAPPGPGWCFFFAVAPPGRSLTHGGLGRFRQGPGGVFFFLLRPRRVFLDNSKKCLGYYIGSKKTRRGHSKKKNTTSRKTTL